MRAVFAHACAFRLIPAFARGGFERPLGHTRRAVFLGVESGKMLADDLVGTVALDALGPAVPGGDDAVAVELEDRVVDDGVHEPPEALLALNELLAGHFPVGHVAG